MRRDAIIEQRVDFQAKLSERQRPHPALVVIDEAY